MGCRTLARKPFRYADADIGNWGYDLLAGLLIVPSDKDIISQSTPRCISDCTYAALAERVDAE